VTARTTATAASTTAVTVSRRYLNTLPKQSSVSALELAAAAF
jgi:hypothetical protein